MSRQSTSRSSAFCLLMTALCLGCDTAGKQQQAEDARKAATAAALEQAGEEMHGNTKSEVQSKD